MWDGSAVPMDENLQIADELLAECAKARIVMEMEIGVVGGEEDDVVGEMSDKLYSTPRTPCAPPRPLARASAAATCWPPPSATSTASTSRATSSSAELLNELQRAVGEKVGKDKPFDLVFHGGSGSLLAEIRESITYGVIKMNVDTDTQYALTRPIADHFFKNYDGVLKVDGDVGVKKTYDPRTYMAKAEESMAARVVQACEDLQSAGTSMANA